MRRLIEVLFFLFPLLILVGLIFVYQNSTIPKANPQKTKTTSVPTKKPKQTDRFQYVYFRLNNLARLKLIFNRENEDVSVILERENCQAALNGGFYDKEKNPLGLLVTEGKEISPARESALFNGYLWLTKEGAFGITAELPESEFNLALQSGPLLFEGGVEQKLSIENDKLSRRSLVAYLSTGEIILLTIYDPNSLYSGPYLAKLPALLANIALLEDFTVVDALNLDGGSSSFYRDKELFLNEYRTVKSLFCVLP